MQDIRCGNCHKKLGAGTYMHLSMKCPRCKTMNTYRAMSTALLSALCASQARL